MKVYLTQWLGLPDNVLLTKVQVTHDSVFGDTEVGSISGNLGKPSLLYFFTFQKPKRAHVKRFFTILLVVWFTRRHTAFVHHISKKTLVREKYRNREQHQGVGRYRRHWSSKNLNCYCWKPNCYCWNSNCYCWEQSQASCLGALVCLTPMTSESLFSKLGL